jgi:hypothetical protein
MTVVDEKFWRESLRDRDRRKFGDGIHSTHEIDKGLRKVGSEVLDECCPFRAGEFRCGRGCPASGVSESRMPKQMIVMGVSRETAHDLEASCPKSLG